MDSSHLGWWNTVLLSSKRTAPTPGRDLIGSRGAEDPAPGSRSRWRPALRPPFPAWHRPGPGPGAPPSWRPSAAAPSGARSAVRAGAFCCAPGARLPRPGPERPHPSRRPLARCDGCAVARAGGDFKRYASPASGRRGCLPRLRPRAALGVPLANRPAGAVGCWPVAPGRPAPPGGRRAARSFRAAPAAGSSAAVPAAGAAGLARPRSAGSAPGCVGARRFSPPVPGCSRLLRAPFRVPRRAPGPVLRARSRPGSPSGRLFPSLLRARGPQARLAPRS